MEVKTLIPFTFLLATTLANPLPQFPSLGTSFVDEASSSADSVKIDVGPRTTSVIAAALPSISEALIDPSGTPMERFSKITLGFLPVARNVIEARAEESKDYAKRKDEYLRQQEAAESVVPSILESIVTFINGLPPAGTQAPVFIPPVRTVTFDNPSVPDQTIEGHTIPATQFSPSIRIPDIKVQ